MHCEGWLRDYLGLAERNPTVARNAWQRLLDMIEFHGYVKPAAPCSKLFDGPFDGGRDAVFGLDEPLGRPLQVFHARAQAPGAKERVLQSHGPLDSASSTVAHLLRTVLGGLPLVAPACQAGAPMASCGSLLAESSVVAHEPISPCSLRQEPQGKDGFAVHDGGSPGVPSDATQGDSAPSTEAPADRQAGAGSLDLPSPRRGRSRDVRSGNRTEDPQRAGDWLNPAGAWASIASLVISLYVLVAVRSIKGNLVARARLPRILADLREIDAALKTQPDRQQVRIHVGRLSSCLRTVATLRTSPRVKREAKSLLSWVDGATAEGVRRGLAGFMVTLQGHLDEENLRGS